MHENTPTRRLNFEYSLYIIALSLALLVRLYHLGAAPLSDWEAARALQALTPTQNGNQWVGANLPSQPVYNFLTNLLFELLGSQTFLARFWPAVIGAILVLVPLFFRRELGRQTALILAFGLALDPGLVTVSRLAGGPMLGIVFLLVSLSCIWSGLSVLAGISFGLALLSGPTVLIGLVGFGLMGFIFHLLKVPNPHPSRSELSDFRLFPALIAAALTLIIVGTSFLSFPQSFAGWTATFTEFVRGWWIPSGIPAGRLLGALLVYQPLGAFFFLGLLLYWLVRQSLTDKIITPPPLLPLVWISVNLLILLVYPGRQVADLIWVLVPLWILAAYGLTKSLQGKEINVISTALGLVIFVLIALFWNTLISTRQILAITSFNLPENTSRLVIRLVLFLGVVGLGGLSTVLVSLGWSPRIGLMGLFIGLTAGFMVYSISVMWGASQIHPNRPEELWTPEPATAQTDLFTRTIEDLSEWHTGFPTEIEIASMVDSPSMHWTLRKYKNARFVDSLSPEDMPSIVITQQDQEIPSLTAAYRGQDFVWWIEPGWAGSMPVDLVNWLVSRQAPIIENQVILWARSDLFPGGGTETQTNQDTLP
jgi:hypothetical protein